jgi:hypothetical protein
VALINDDIRLSAQLGEFASDRFGQRELPGARPIEPRVMAKRVGVHADEQQ